jgi:hypothetical protein
LQAEVGRCNRQSAADAAADTAIQDDAGKRPAIGPDRQRLRPQADDADPVNIGEAADDSPRCGLRDVERGHAWADREELDTHRAGDRP